MNKYKLIIIISVLFSIQSFSQMVGCDKVKRVAKKYNYDVCVVYKSILAESKDADNAAKRKMPVSSPGYSNLYLKEFDNRLKQLAKEIKMKYSEIQFINEHGWECCNP